MRFTIINTEVHSVVAEGVIDQRVAKFSYPLIGEIKINSAISDCLLLNALESLLSKDFSACFTIKQLRSRNIIKVCSPENLVIKCLVSSGCMREAEIINSKHPIDFKRKLGTTISQMFKYNMTKIVNNVAHYITVPVDKLATIPYYVLKAQDCYVMEG